jgi:hypothetical protein
MARTAIQEGVSCPNRSAASSIGFFSGWIAAGVCEMGVIPAFLAGFGITTGYMGSSILWGLGWIPVVGAFSIALVFGSSYLLTRKVFATRPREIAMRSYWMTVRTTAFVAGLSFVGWILLSMSIIYALGGGTTNMKM